MVDRFILYGNSISSDTVTLDQGTAWSTQTCPRVHRCFVHAGSVCAAVVCVVHHVRVSFDVHTGVLPRQTPYLPYEAPSPWPPVIAGAVVCVRLGPTVYRWSAYPDNKSMDGFVQALESGQNIIGIMGARTPTRPHLILCWQP